MSNQWLEIFKLKKKSRKKKLPIKKKLLYFLPIIGFFGVVLFLLLTLGAFAWVAKDLPSPDQVVRKEGFATRIYDRNGELLYDVYDQAKRTPVKFEEIPQELKQATIAIEDKNFYSHPGFSIRGITRAMFNILIKQKLQGGSTLTQQLVKNVLLTRQRTLLRKWREFILALQIERKYSKDEILQMYLNEAPYGGPAWGVQAASERYFNKSAKDLSLIESAFLAGLPQRPTVYSPYHGDAWKGRTEAVLRRMREDGYISKENHEKAVEEIDKLEFSSPQGVVKAPHFVMHVKERLADMFGEKLVEGGGLKVTTSLDWELQKQAQSVVSNEIDEVEYLNINNGAALVLEPQTGQVLSMVGSRGYDSEKIDGKFNVVTQALRQPGSSIKPVTYLTGLQKGYTASTLLMDVRTVFPQKGNEDYIPVNYDGTYHGPMQVRYALGNSINVPAVKMLAMVGLESMLSTAEEMGISTLAPTEENLKRLGLATTLGGGEVKPIELGSAYLAFANGGVKREPTVLLKVEDHQGNVLYENKQVKGKQVISPGEAFIISDILSDNQARAMTFGTTSGLVIGNRKVAVKTGTTNDMKDNWAVGWTPKALVLSWVGNNDNTSMKRVASGISGATPIWREIMIEAINKYGYEEFKQPADVVTAEIDKVSGYRAHDGFPSRTEYFVKGTVPNEADPIHVMLKLCEGEEKLATPPQIASGNYIEKEFFKFKAEDPVSWDGKNRWQEAILNWMYQQDDPRYHPPTEYCDDQGRKVEVDIRSPSDKTTVGNNFTVEFDAVAINDIEEVKVYLDGEEVETFSSKPYELDMTLEDGAYTLRVEAEDSEGNTDDEEFEFGVNKPWDWSPSPTAKPTKETEPTNTPKPTETEDVTPTEEEE
jgi:1A family penicillin-binding protein